MLTQNKINGSQEPVVSRMIGCHQKVFPKTKSDVDVTRSSIKRV